LEPKYIWEYIFQEKTKLHGKLQDIEEIKEEGLSESLLAKENEILEKEDKLELKEKTL
jgi:hypothetical protein